MKNAEKVLNAQYRKFKLKYLFHSETGNVDLQQKDINGKGCYFINSGVDNTGIKGKTDREAKIFPKNTITIDFWGNAYYRDFEYKLATHNHVFSLSGDVIKNEQVGLYLVAQMSYFKKIFSYNKMGTWNRYKDFEILLPVRMNDDGTPILDFDHAYHPDGYLPDFDYMQDRIRELEQDRIRELELYLKATGLSSYVLTDEDREIIEKSIAKKFDRKFKIVDLFEIENSHNILKSDVIFGSGNIPYVTAGSSNNGILGYINYNKDMLENGNCIFIGGKSMTVSYQEKDFFSNDSHNLLLTLKDTNERTEKKQLFLACAIYKSLSSKYTWNNSISYRKIQSDIFCLPICLNDDGTPVIDHNHTYHPDGYVPDFDYMEKYIRAIQKMVITDVVKYKDSVIEQTRKVTA